MQPIDGLKFLIPWTNNALTSFQQKSISATRFLLNQSLILIAKVNTLYVEIRRFTVKRESDG